MCICKMGKKHNLILLFGILIIVSLLLIYIINSKYSVKKYSDNPKNWVEKRGSIKSIDIEEVTGGGGYIDTIGQQYNDDEISTAFKYSGFYMGEYFDAVYYNPEGKILMRITKDMKPYDNVIEGFIIERIKNKKPIVYVFLDEDWKNKIGRTYIRYGISFEKKGLFTFREIEKGIYMDSFEDDTRRFLNNYTVHLGGIIVGDVSDEKIENEDSNITLIKLE